MRVHNRSFGMRDLLYLNNLKAVFQVAYENIRFSTLFAAGDVSRETSQLRRGEEHGETDVFAG